VTHRWRSQKQRIPALRMAVGCSVPRPATTSRPALLWARAQASSFPALADLVVSGGRDAHETANLIVTGPRLHARLSAALVRSAVLTFSRTVRNDEGVMRTLERAGFPVETEGFPRYRWSPAAIPVSESRARVSEMASTALVEKTRPSVPAAH
jgi:hypothetical protein